MVRITDLHQGIVYGTQTALTKKHDDLINKFYYDGDNGTVLNRFIMQAAVEHPLTIHGRGGQTRAFIHLRDSLQCIRMALENPPEKGDRVKIFNQAAQTLNINDLALKIYKKTGCELRYYKNPRNEDAANELRLCNEGFKSLGWKPIMLDDVLVEEIYEIAMKYKHRCDMDKIICTSTWRNDMDIDLEGSETKK